MGENFFDIVIKFMGKIFGDRNKVFVKFNLSDLYVFHPAQPPPAQSQGQLDQSSSQPNLGDSSNSGPNTPTRNNSVKYPATNHQNIYSSSLSMVASSSRWSSELYSTSPSTPNASISKSHVSLM